MEAEEHIENTFQNGESLKDVEKRISNFIDEINGNILGKLALYIILIYNVNEKFFERRNFMLTDEIRQIINLLLEKAQENGMTLDMIQKSVSEAYESMFTQKDNIEEKVTNFVENELKYGSYRAQKYAIDILVTFYNLRKYSFEEVSCTVLSRLASKKTGLSEGAMSIKFQYLKSKIIKYMSENDVLPEKILICKNIKIITVLEVFYQRYMRSW